MAAPNTHIRGSVRDILLASILSSVPLVALSAILLGLVFRNRVYPSSPLSDIQGAAASENDDSVIYVNLSATTLTVLASWSSTIAPLTLTYILSLASFPAAREMIRAAVNTLSALVFATDAWLHFTTKSVTLTQFEPVSFDDASFGLHQNCTNLTESFTSQCDLNRGGSTTFLWNAEESLNLLANVSTRGMVQSVSDDAGNQYAYIGLPVGLSNGSVDYVATSLAVQTKCAPITTRCFNATSTISGPSANYSCDFAMQGTISTTFINSMNMGYFTNSTLSDTIPEKTPISNPYYFAAVVSANQNVGRNQDLIHDPEINSGEHGSVLFVVLCNATVFDMVYTSANSTVTQVSVLESNSSTTSVVMGTQAYTHVGDTYILQRTSLDVWQSHSAQEIASKFAYTYSEIALAASGAALEPGPAVEAQLRSSMIVAKMPKAPLGCLVAANLLLAVLGILLTIMALLVLNNDVGDVKARLGIPALVATHFETNGGDKPVKNIEDMFEEFDGRAGPRVVAAKTALGCWRLERR
ncbi:hypothetical protein MAA_08127 [Metarhizium robertsii ARSEF 23]|uniref:Uncharacterized protein n=1 Tax=Metarhizium robertsii (strain ARSEF 23 / ATCC MYA-3075) TaxID=655844 RepID=E9F790_METRA|nr:uncharacterized protein MAA_08127 [Metarhizium robertsii ARSEF 23]EFY96420.1 hypothetical protein MAA_08127 [Metarhizium robertsii ARSEF 23]